MINADGQADESGTHSVAFARLSGSSTGTFGQITNHVGGTYTALFTGILAGSPTTVIASIDGEPVTTTLPTISVTPGPLSLAQSTVGVSQGALASGSAVTLRLITRDAAGNLLTSGGASVVFNHNRGTSTGTITETIDNRNGTYSAIFTGVLAGTSTSIGATINGSPVTTTLPTLAVYPGSISRNQSVITTSSSTVGIGNSVTVTLFARDAAGNNIYTGGSTIVFYHSDGQSAGSFSAASNHGGGTYSATFTGTVARIATMIGATIDGGAVTTTLPTITVQAN